MDTFNFKLFGYDRLRFSRDAPKLLHVDTIWDSYLDWSEQKKAEDHTYKGMSKKKFSKRINKMDIYHINVNNGNLIHWICFKTDEEAEEYDNSYRKLKELKHELADLRDEHCRKAKEHEDELALLSGKN